MKSTVSVSCSSDFGEDGQRKQRSQKTNPSPFDVATLINALNDSCSSDTSVASSTSGQYGAMSSHSCALPSSVRRRGSLSFDDKVQVITIPRILFEDDYDSDDEEEEIVKKVDLVKKADLFYMQHEINLWRCEEKMRKEGMDPNNFDWRSMR